MKKSLAVSVAGKIDAVFDSKTERLRRHSVLLLLFGVGTTAMFVWSALEGKKNWLDAIIALVCYAGSLWEYLAFKHSLSIRKELDSLVQTPDDSITRLNLSDSNDADLGQHDETEQAERFRYCSGCGASVQGQRFCPACGTDISAVVKALTKKRNWPWLGKQIDAYVRRVSYDDKIYALALWIMLLVVPREVSRIADGDISFRRVMLFAGLLIVSLWDFVVYRRRLASQRDLPPRRSAPPSPDQGQVREASLITAPFVTAEEPTQKIGIDTNSLHQ